MNYKQSYVPKRKKVNYKIVVPFLLLIGILVFASVSMFFPSDTPQVKEMAICGLTPRKSRDVISRLEVEHTRLFSDYGVYGETLGIYQNEFVVGDKDPFMGKTLYLRNVCTDEEYSYLMGVELDSKIPIENLENGFYEVEILNGLTRERLVASDQFDDTFTALAQDGDVKSLRLVADKTLFDTPTETELLSDHFLFFEVKSEVIPENVYDVVIDPGGLMTFDNGKIDFGYKRKDIIEADLMYEYAQGVKDILEAKGLKVLSVRDNETPIETFGPNSRLHKAYGVKAKYYFQLNLDFSFYKPDKGMTILYSNYASNHIATSIMKELNLHSNLPVSYFTSGNNLEGVYQPRLVNNRDNRDIIREAGGKFTGAGLNEEFKTLNTDHTDSRYGIQTVVIDYGYINDDITYDALLMQKDAIIQATAQGILNGLRID